jgi:surface antigen
MRTTVLTGLFACAVLFVIGATPVDASALTARESVSDSNVKIMKVASADAAIIPRIAPVRIVANITETENVEAEEIAPIQEIKKYTVEKNDSLEKIGNKFEISWQRIYDKNTQITDPDTINVNDVIIIPRNDEVLEKREIPVPAPVLIDVVVPASRQNPAQSATTRSQPVPVRQPQEAKPAAAAQRGSASGNNYTAGYCTWYVKNRRPDLPNNLGNANTWYSRATAQGMATGSAPRVGAVGVSTAGSLGHVVYVESVNPNGSVNVSEMNFRGLYVTSTRTVAASNFRYIY